MEKRLFLRRYSHIDAIENAKDVDYVVGEETFNKVLEQLEIEYYAERKVSKTLSGDIECSMYLVHGGIARVNKRDGKAKTIEVLTESAQGMVGITEELNLPFNEDYGEGPMPKRREQEGKRRSVIDTIPGC